MFIFHHLIIILFFFNRFGYNRFGNKNKMTGIIKHRDFGNDSNLKTSTNAHLTSPLLITPHILNDEVDNIDYHFEAARLQSFENWPVSYVEKLARFYSLFIRVKSCFI